MKVSIYQYQKDKHTLYYKIEKIIYVKNMNRQKKLVILTFQTMKINWNEKWQKKDMYTTHCSQFFHHWMCTIYFFLHKIIEKISRSFVCNVCAACTKISWYDKYSWCFSSYWIICDCQSQKSVLAIKMKCANTYIDIVHTIDMWQFNNMPMVHAYRFTSSF